MNNYSPHTIGGCVELCICIQLYTDKTWKNAYLNVTLLHKMRLLLYPYDNRTVTLAMHQ